MAIASVPIVGGWGLTFGAIGRWDAAALNFGYCAVTAILLGLLALTRRIEVLRVPHLFAVLLGPFALQFYLGGFVGSGGAMFWSLLAPVAATMFRGARRAALWFVAVIALAALSWAGAGVSWARPLAPAQSSAYLAFNFIGFSGFLLLSTDFFIRRIARERARADGLLLNLFPAPVADALKRHPERKIARRFDGATVLFTDLVGFTSLSQTMPAGALVDLLNEIFSGFDQLAERHGLEKIKTIGDAYMAVGGLPLPADDHARRVASFALDAQEFLTRFAKERGLPVVMRVGIHTGEVVAGVIGRRKLAYDLWGDTVNTASRMESHGAPGRIQVSAATRAALGESFRFAARGTIAVKGKGEMETFWLEGRA
jgi:guanylate cyclase